MDNAANNFTALDALADMLPENSLIGRMTAVRCTCHTFNLVMKVCLLHYVPCWLHTDLY